MRSPARPLLVLHEDGAFVARMRKAAEPEFSVECVRSWSFLYSALRSAPAAAMVVADPYHATPSSLGLAPELKDVLRKFPLASMVAVLEIRPGRASDLRRLGEWGVAEVVGPRETAAALAQTLQSLRGRALQVMLERALGERLSGRAESIVNSAAEVAATGGQAEGLATALHASPRTLLRWCTRFGLPPPRRLLAWMRLLLAAEMLGHPGRSVQSVAKACGYASDSGLRRAFSDFLGASPRELGRAQAFRRVADAFARELEGAPRRAPTAARELAAFDSSGV
jgi:AraC-like DNA-binding protein